MANAVKPTGSLPPNARCYSGGQHFSLLPCRMMSTRPSRASRLRLGVARASRCSSMQHEKGRETRDAGSNSSIRKAYMVYSSEGLGSTQDRSVDKSGSAVPEAYTRNLHCQLSTVDVLQNMGISRHFAGDIKRILDMAYSRWLQRDEEIMLDVATCAMAFRIFRMNGYDVSSDELSHFAEASAFHNSLEGYLSDTRSLLELHKASKVTISEDEFILDSIGSWSGFLLKEQLISSDAQTTPLLREVEYALNYPFYTTLDRLDHRRNIENFDVTGHQMLITSLLPFHTNEDILALAVRDFSSSQSIYREELQHLVWALQWLDLLRSMMTEVQWRMSEYVPTAEEYMTNAALTFALGPIVLPALYFVGPKIPESVVRDPEYCELFRLMSTCGRLLNDVQSYEREDSQGKLNSVSLLVLHKGGSMSTEEARREIQKPIDTCRRDLLRLVLKEESAVPRPCRELFWKMCKVCFFFYSRTDGFSSSVEKASEVNAVINEPLQLDGSNGSLSLSL
ncbi:ent-kaurene synthase-like 2 [Phragmites australis]|uniref:ent-kaurene synthase-like 2 n=1 Tax=Phragmites australis TaxID=29695 RepID=UPI002D78745E|nr:ent-kaurene synthase-like 2 [Phragmites australis]